MPAGNYVSTPPDPEETFNDLLSYAELPTTPQLARLYIYILQHEPVTIDEIKGELEMAHSATYKYVGQLEKMRIVTRNENKTPTTALATPLQLEIDGAHGGFLATSAVIDAIGRQFENDDMRVFVDRQGVAKLAAAVHYTRRTMEGEVDLGQEVIDVAVVRNQDGLQQHQPRAYSNSPERADLSPERI